MKGYKALDKDMKAIHGDGMQYELGKTYILEGKIIPYQNGFHFCKKIEQLNTYYDISTSRIFEIEAYGNIKKCGQKYVAEEIQLVRELTKKEINDYFRQNQQVLVKNGLCDIREAVVKQGYGLDILVNDKNWQVRREVARQGYGLDVLVNDKNWLVRRAVAKQGYGLDMLISDESWLVRIAVAEQGYGLDVLVNDEDEDVRRAAIAMKNRSNTI